MPSASRGELLAKPLSGKRVLVTRAGDQAQAASRLLTERGAEAVVVSTIELFPPRDQAAVAAALLRLASYEWVVFTSANGVRWAWEAALAVGLDARAFATSRLAAIGPATAEAMRERGLSAHVVAKELKGEGLASELLAAMATAVDARAARVLILRAQEARMVLPEILRAAGAAVDVVAVYETRPVPNLGDTLRRALTEAHLDAVTFTSSSTLDNLCDAIGPDAPALLAPLVVVSIGPITTQSAEARGVRVDATADPSTIAGLVDALAATFARRSSA